MHSRPDPGTEPVATEGDRWVGRQVGRILIVEHVPHFGPGRIESILWEHRLNPSRVLPYEGTPFPADISDLDGLILLGRPEAGDDSRGQYFAVFLLSGSERLPCLRTYLSFNG